MFKRICWNNRDKNCYSAERFAIYYVSALLVKLESENGKAKYREGDKHALPKLPGRPENYRTSGN